jgi:hypothetical protein
MRRCCLNPFEEKFDLPSALVERRDRQRWQGCVVGEKDERGVGLGVFVTNMSQMFGIPVTGFVAIERYSLIADQSCSAIDRRRVEASCVHVSLGPRDEECGRLMKFVEASEIEVAAVHHVERSRFDGHEVENIDLVRSAVADVNEGWDSATKIEQRVHLDRCLAVMKWRPVEQAQTQVDGRSVQSIDRVLQIQSEIGIAVKFASSTNEHGSHVGPDAPIARFVGIGKRRAMNAVAKAHGIELGGIGRQGDFDVAERFAPSQLRKCHDTKLLRTGKAPDAQVAGIAIYDSAKAGPRNKLHDLCEQRLARVHALALRISIPQGGTKIAFRDSNRHQLKMAGNPRQDSFLREPIDS